jgi:hypothetical protein
MHNHPLYVEVSAECRCCKILRTFSFKSTTDHVICKSCERHYGDGSGKAAQQARDHAGLYWSELQISIEDRHRDQERHLAELRYRDREITEKNDIIAQKNVVIDDLETAVRTGNLNPAVEKWLADEEVRDALNKRDSAYRSRDYSFTALWRITQLHHLDERRQNKCSCGRSERGCRELAAISDELDVIHRWETEQVDRLRTGLEHGLPHDHPEVAAMGGRSLRNRWRTS